MVALGCIKLITKTNWDKNSRAHDPNSFYKWKERRPPFVIYPLVLQDSSKYPFISYMEEFYDNQSTLEHV